MSNKPKTGKIIECQTCKKEFYIPINRFKTAKFCSMTCMGASARKRFIGLCEICKKSFSFIACREDKAKYCSRKCYYKAMRLKGSVIKKCLFCQKEFKTSPSHNRVYCSRLCTWEAKKKTITGNFSCVRKALKSQQMITHCAECGYSLHPEILGVHHIDKTRTNNELNNLLVLCPNCHSFKHKKHVAH